MQLEALYLYNFTNYAFLEYDVSSFLNFFVGNNAQGKSNLLDSIYYLSFGRSSRYARDLDLVKWGNTSFQIAAKVKGKNGTFNLKITYQKGKKELFINENKAQKLGEYIGFLNVVFFSPDDLLLVKGSPALRRKYLDDEITQVSPQYYAYLQQYHKILAQRNNLLREIKNHKVSLDNLLIWDEQMVKIGAKILAKRLEMYRRLKPLARLAHRRLSSAQEELEINYLSSLSLGELKEWKLKDLEEIFRQGLSQNLEEDLYRGYTTVGPHRDDFALKINGVDVKTYGSQGQQRTAALSLKLAELEFMYSERGEYPVLLLDDVLSELDRRRREQLLAAVTDKIQTFITCTETDFLDEEILKRAAVYRIKKGTVQRLSFT